ncbi:CcmA Integral membrane protein CcmA involved in cell shape determination [Oxalobacteraceae bacterium]
MADTNTPGSLLVGEGVFMKGSMRVPGLATIDGKLEGELTADTVHIQTNGSMNGRTTASHVRVAGAATDTTIANKTLVIESSGLIAGSITYTELEIKKGGSLQGSINKVGQQPQNFAPPSPPAPPAPPVVAAPEPEVQVPPAPAPAPEEITAAAPANAPVSDMGRKPRN